LQISVERSFIPFNDDVNLQLNIAGIFFSGKLGTIIALPSIKFQLN